MATPPIAPPRPKLEDPLQEREIFATEVSSVWAVHGNIIVTLATTRLDEPLEGTTPKTRRVVTGRVALTSVAAGQLLKNLQDLVTKLEAAAVAKKE